MPTPRKWFYTVHEISAKSVLEVVLDNTILLIPRVYRDAQSVL